jgi:hypothetical protein
MFKFQMLLKEDVNRPVFNSLGIPTKLLAADAGRRLISLLSFVAQMKCFDGIEVMTEDSVLVKDSYTESNSAGIIN